MRVLAYLFAGLAIWMHIEDRLDASDHFEIIAAIMFAGAWLKDEIDELKERL